MIYGSVYKIPNADSNSLFLILSKKKFLNFNSLKYMQNPNPICKTMVATIY